MPMVSSSRGDMAVSVRRTAIGGFASRGVPRPTREARAGKRAAEPSLDVKGDSCMAHRWSWLTAFGVVLGLAAGAASLHAWTTPAGLSYLTFSGPVALPGVTLQAGTY